MISIETPQNSPFATISPETIILRLSSVHAPVKHQEFLQQFGSILPFLNWRGHIFIVDDDPVGQINRACEIVQTVSEYLNNERLVTIYVHPFIRINQSDQSEIGEWESLLKLMQPFQQEAYDQQSEVRMLILPILEPQPDASIESILSTGEFFRNRLAKPSFYFHNRSPLNPQTVVEKDLRAYVDEADSTSANTILAQLRINHVFENILERIEIEQMELFDLCRRHLILDEKEGKAYPCFTQWEKEKPLDSDELPASPPENVNCVHCISHSCLSMENNLWANGKKDEGRQVFMELALAFSNRHNHREAASHARKAYEHSANDADRAAALLHLGLCHLSLSELTPAEESLKEGLKYSSDPGIFLYQLGNVQFARQNYLEAISHFQEALAAGSPEVPRDDLLFNLGISYINLEDFHRARQFLYQMEQKSAPVCFYRGICDFGEGTIESALATFQEALSLGPAPEDLSRVLFYIGTCLKEMGQYNEAVSELEKAIEADPQDYMNYNLLGFCLYQLKQHERAIAVFHQAVEINPGSAIDYASIGSNLRELGRFEDAIAMYQMALSLDPALTFAAENITKLKQRLEE